MFDKFLQKYGESLQNNMSEIIASFDAAPSDLKIMLQYPFGWVDEHGKPYNKSTGKRIRPVVLLLCTEATGGNWYKALPAASAVEILHNFSLVHDDIQDGSSVRHNRSTVWKVWGQPLAINVGDAMFALSYHAVEQLSKEDLAPETVIQVWRIFNQTILELTRGQHLDMRFESETIVSVDEYLSMVTGKTAALLACVAQIGALIGSENFELSAEYAAFGLNLGLAFQIRDDILGIWGDTNKLGKSTATDILYKKKSLPILFGLNESPVLRDVYSKSQLDEADVEHAVSLLNSVNAQDYAREVESQYYQSAIAALSRAKPKSPASEDIMQLVDLLFDRQY